MRSSISAQSWRLDPAGARCNGDDGVGEVVLAAEHLLGLGGIDLLARGRRGRPTSPFNTSSPLRRPLEQHVDVVGLPGSARARVRCLRRGGAAPSVFCASAWLSQKLAPATFCSSCASSPGSWASSKIAPHVGGPSQQVGGAANEVINHGGQSTQRPTYRVIGKIQQSAISPAIALDPKSAIVAGRLLAHRLGA